MTEEDFLRWALRRITEWDHEDIRNMADHEAHSSADIGDRDACVGCFARMVADAGEQAAHLIMERCK